MHMLRQVIIESLQEEASNIADRTGVGEVLGTCHHRIVKGGGGEVWHGCLDISIYHPYARREADHE